MGQVQTCSPEQCSGGQRCRRSFRDFQEEDDECSVLQVDFDELKLPDFLSLSGTKGSDISDGVSNKSTCIGTASGRSSPDLAGSPRHLEENDENPPVRRRSFSRCVTCPATPTGALAVQGSDPDVKPQRRRMLVRRMSTSNAFPTRIATDEYGRQKLIRENMERKLRRSEIKHESFPKMAQIEETTEETSEEAHLILKSIPELTDVSFVKFSHLYELPVPWPRCQEVPADCFAAPRATDFVLAVSHMWFFQTHPDPMGQKIATIQELVSDARAIHSPMGETLLFLDFLGLTQPPFKVGQAPRTKAQSDEFSACLRAMPLFYLYADALILLDEDVDKESPVVGDGELVSVDCSDLRNVELLQVGKDVQVTAAQASGDVEPYDYVHSIYGQPVHSLSSFNRLLHNKSSQNEVATIRKAPYGRRNCVHASLRGWIYLERFIAMVKVAMRQKTDAEVVFSSSPKLLEKIHEGAERLRAAARDDDEEMLRRVLHEHVEELKQKSFSATSIDKVSNTGGAGGVKDAVPPSDRSVVESIMWEMVEYLYGHWGDEVRVQQTQKRRARWRKAVRKISVLRAFGARFASCPTIVTAGTSPREAA